MRFDRDKINDAPLFSGFPPGTVRLVSMKVDRPAWPVRLWNWFRGRQTQYAVRYVFDFGAGPGRV